MFLAVPPPDRKKVEPDNSSRGTPPSLTRAAAARAAFRCSRWWANRVIGLSFPVVLGETCIGPLTHGSGSWTRGVTGAVLFAGCCWGIWVGCATFVAWCRSAVTNAAPVWGVALVLAALALVLLMAC